MAEFLVAPERNCVPLPRDMSLVRGALAEPLSIALYGVAQHLGLDPINWITDSVSPVLSTMGRSNFLGAYLAMVLPFSLSRILRPVDGTQRLRYAIILLLQMSCLLLTQARAAWLGFTVGCLLFLALLARRWRSWPLVPQINADGVC